MNTLNSATTDRQGYAPINGLNLYYEIEGAGDPLVYIPPAFRFAGVKTFPALAQSRAVITVDLQRHGRTAHIQDRPLSNEQHASVSTGPNVFRGQEREEGEEEMTTTLAKDITVERTIPAPPSEVFDAWLDPKVPGTLWHEHDKLIFNPKVDGLWYLLSLAHRSEGTPHYGRFTEINRPRLIRHSWMSRHTLGEESMVTMTFEIKGVGTLLTLRHSGLPNEVIANAHEQGWNSILDKFRSTCVSGSHRRK